MNTSKKLLYLEGLVFPNIGVRKPNLRLVGSTESTEIYRRLADI